MCSGKPPVVLAASLPLLPLPMLLLLPCLLPLVSLVSPR
jgi:hypothetical protein